MSRSIAKFEVIENALPQSQEELIARLLAEFDNLPGQLQLCARYIIDHPHEVGLQSMRTLAANAKVQPNSFVRLARHFGFAGYDAMRERFRDFVRGGIGSSPDRLRWLQQMDREGGSTAIFGSMAEACLDNTEKMFAQQSVPDLESAVDLMINARRVYILGLGLAYPLAYNFWYVARMGFDHFVLTPRHGSLPADDLIRLDERDCLVAMTFQPYRRDTLAAVRRARQAGAKKCITWFWWKAREIRCWGTTLQTTSSPDSKRSIRRAPTCRSRVFRMARSQRWIDDSPWWGMA